jgi:putative tricarboxylic transport membrane protein
MAARRPGRTAAELAISVGMLALGVGAAVVAFRLPEAGGYARIGPNFMPKVVACGLVALGVWLLAEFFSGGWREAVPVDPAARGEHAFRFEAFAWVSAGLALQMVLVHTAGFVLAAMGLFACVARGFGSTRIARDLAAGAILGLGVFLFFVKFLNVGLPAGWLQPVLGGAGL